MSKTTTAIEPTTTAPGGDAQAKQVASPLILQGTEVQAATTDDQPPSKMAEGTPRATFDPTTATMPENTEKIETGKPGEFSITLDYYEFEQDVPVRGIYLGIAAHTCINKQTGELKTIPGAVFVTARKVRGVLVKENKINASVKFVDAFRNMNSGFPFEATMTGRKQKGERSIAHFHIVQLL